MSGHQRRSDWPATARRFALSDELARRVGIRTALGEITMLYPATMPLADALEALGRAIDAAIPIAIDQGGATDPH